MPSLVEFLEQRSELTTSALAEFVGEYVRDRWKLVLREQRDKLLDTFDRVGEPAYGVYFTALMRPLRQQFAAAGLSTEPAFPGALPYSVEEWGGPMDDRARQMWFVVTRDDQPAPMGTIVVRFFHDHTRFRVPRSPEVIALDVTDPAAIVRILTDGASNDWEAPPGDDPSADQVIDELSESIDLLLRENRELRRQLGQVPDGAPDPKGTNGS
jgi:hypothetical protein